MLRYGLRLATSYRTSGLVEPNRMIYWEIQQFRFFVGEVTRSRAVSVYAGAGQQPPAAHSGRRLTHRCRATPKEAALFFLVALTASQHRGRTARSSAPGTRYRFKKLILRMFSGEASTDSHQVEKLGTTWAQNRVC